MAAGSLQMFWYCPAHGFVVMEAADPAKEALLNLSRFVPNYGPCWCGVSVGDPRCTDHSPQCKAANIAVGGSHGGKND